MSRENLSGIREQCDSVECPSGKLPASERCFWKMLRMTLKFQAREISPASTAHEHFQNEKHHIRDEENLSVVKSFNVGASWAKQRKKSFILKSVGNVYGTDIDFQLD